MEKKSEDKPLDLFGFRSYENYLNTYFSNKSARSGAKSRLSKCLQCQPAFLSKILRGEAHLSLEMAYMACDYFGFTASEKEYFMLLVQHERAGSQSLRDYHDEKIQVILEEKKNIQKQLDIDCVITQEDRATYYGHWLYVSIHMLISIEGKNTIDEIITHFRIERSEVKKVIDFLVFKKIIIEKEGRFYPGMAHMHLDKSSLFTQQHHKNWRLKGMKDLESFDSKNKSLHYTVLYSLSKKDAENIKRKIVKLIEENIEIIAPSKEEVVYCNTIDFFPI